MKGPPKCCYCKRDCTSKLDQTTRKDGRFVCQRCWTSWSFKRYREHWFVRDLEYKKPTIAAKRTRKPLPGQQDLGFSEEELYE